MDQFRRAAAAAEDKDHQESPRSATFNPPSIIRDSSAFSKPILPTSSSLLSPKAPLFGSPSPSSNGVSALPDPFAPSACYRECLRNHAASLGGHVVDGCGEFMPLAPTEPLKCAACGCHRSFHRREAEQESSPKTVPLLLPPNLNPLRFSGNNTDQSSSEERNTNNLSNNNNNNNNNNYNSRSSSYNYKLGSEGRKNKRFRTKFSGEQKEKMRAFAERVGWRVQKKDEGEMERFCSEVGVSRQVLKVWMHNNKHLFVKSTHDLIQANQRTESIKVERVQQQLQFQEQQQDGVA